MRIDGLRIGEQQFPALFMPAAAAGYKVPNRENWEA